MATIIGFIILFGIVGFFVFLILFPVVGAVWAITSGLICGFTGKDKVSAVVPEADEDAKARITVEIFAEKPFTIEEMALINEYREEQEAKESSDDAVVCCAAII